MAAIDSVFCNKLASLYIQEAVEFVKGIRETPDKIAVDVNAKVYKRDPCPDSWLLPCSRDCSDVVHVKPKVDLKNVIIGCGSDIPINHTVKCKMTGVFALCGETPEKVFLNTKDDIISDMMYMFFYTHHYCKLDNYSLIFQVGIDRAAITKQEVEIDLHVRYYIATQSLLKCS